MVLEASYQANFSNPSRRRFNNIQMFDVDEVLFILFICYNYACSTSTLVQYRRDGLKRVEGIILGKVLGTWNWSARILGNNPLINFDNTYNNF
jgi:hypothetical protein